MPNQMMALIQISYLRGLLIVIYFSSLIFSVIWTRLFLAVPLLFGVTKFLDLGEVGVVGECDLKSNVDILRSPFIRRIYFSDIPVVTGTSFCSFCGIVLIRLSCIG